MIPLAAFAILLAASFTQTVTGFGFALVAVPLLAQATDARTAVVGAALVSPLITVSTAVRERAHVRWRTAAAIVAAALLGMPFGLLVLRGAPERALTALIGVVALACTLIVWRGLRIGTSVAMVGMVGVLSGALGTATGTNGPPLVAAFQAMGYDPRTFRATIAAVFTGSGVLGLAAYAVAGQVRPSAVGVGLAGAPAVALGWWAGNRLFARIDPLRFRRLVIVALLLSCTITLLRALAGWIH
jgi:uncharacterized membrane protein YfcA